MQCNAGARRELEINHIARAALYFTGARLTMRTMRILYSTPILSFRNCIGAARVDKLLHRINHFPAVSKLDRCDFNGGFPFVTRYLLFGSNANTARLRSVTLIKLTQMAYYTSIVTQDLCASLLSAQR